jgi:hypothetical protein
MRPGQDGKESGRAPQATRPLSNCDTQRARIALSAQPGVPQTFRAGDFLDSLGVNVHVEYTDGKYGNISDVVGDLAYTGITHVRDATLNAANQGQASYAVLAEAGLKFDLIFLGSNIPTSFSLLDKFIEAHPGAVDALEGPNEINNWPITYNGLKGLSAALAYQASLYKAAMADPLLQGAEIYNFTDVSMHSAPATANNLHAYVPGGAQPHDHLAAVLKAQLAAECGKAVVDTETGYPTLTNAAHTSGVDARTQAKLTLNLLFDSFQLGYQRTYIYQLLDAYPDPKGTNADAHFGIFDFSNHAKPLATGLHNLTTLLRDPGSDSTSFQTAPLKVRLDGLPSTGHSLLFEKSNGDYDLAIWNEPTIWHDTSHRPMRAQPSTVVVKFTAPFESATVYDPLAGASPVQSVRDSQLLQVGLTDHPVIVAITQPAAQAGRTDRRR